MDSCAYIAPHLVDIDRTLSLSSTPLIRHKDIIKERHADSIAKRNGLGHYGRSTGRFGRQSAAAIATSLRLAWSESASPSLVNRHPHIGGPRSRLDFREHAV
jgi:hypothetical protein